jgi:3',5'-cyclic AMP phosphodiesterase CpdA
MFMLAHLSDPHLAPLPSLRRRELSAKRALGYVNWQRSRRTAHPAEVLDALVRDLKETAADHIAVTGDLVNIALEAEFAPARAWLATLGSPQDVTVVPGNHDAYVRSARGHAERMWRDYMRGDGDENDAAARFPFLRRRGPLVLIGLSSAVPTSAFLATGRLGAAQLARLAELLEYLRHEDSFRVVLVHHPPGATAWHKRLIDARALRAVLARHGADLVLHGHDHVHSLVWLDGPEHKIPALGVPSASARGVHHPPAAYNLYRIDGAPGRWRCEAISRGFRDGCEAVVELEHRTLIDAKSTRPD